MYAVERIGRRSASVPLRILENTMSVLRKTIVLWLLVVSLCGALVTGCRTVEGAGQDIERAGEGIQDAVR